MQAPRDLTAMILDRLCPKILGTVTREESLEKMNGVVRGAITGEVT